MSAIIRDLQTSVSEHEECITRLRTQYELSQEETESLSQQITELEAEVQSKDHQLNTALQRSVVSGVSDRAQEVREDQLHKVLQGAEEGSSVLKAVVEERDQLLDKVDMAQSEILDLQRRLLEERESLESIQCQLRDVTARNTELVGTVEEAQRELGDVRSERDEAVERVREAEERARAVGGELTTKQTESSKLAKQLEHLKTHLMQVAI